MQIAKVKPVAPGRGPRTSNFPRAYQLPRFVGCSTAIDLSDLAEKTLTEHGDRGQRTKNGMYGNSDSPGPWELSNFDAHGKIMCETVWVAYKTILRVIRRLGEE